MPTPIDVSDRPLGSVSDPGRYLLNLTGSHSHTLNQEAGRGNLIIGPASMGKKPICTSLPSKRSAGRHSILFPHLPDRRGRAI